MNQEETNLYNNPSGYVPGEFSQSNYIFDEYSINENHIIVPADESDENFGKRG